MKKKLTLTIDDDVYDGLGELPRKVSISETVSWLLKALVSEVQGVPEGDFRKLMDSDPRGRVVRQYLKQKIGPMLDDYDAGVDTIKETLKLKKGKK